VGRPGIALLGTCLEFADKPGEHRAAIEDIYGLWSYAHYASRWNRVMDVTGLPLWYQAFGERMIGGENYISPPHLARGLFVSGADGGVLDSEQLASKLDQPWCEADLYYIGKISLDIVHDLKSLPLRQYGKSGLELPMKKQITLAFKAQSNRIILHE
jgi:hypothetical protein